KIRDGSGGGDQRHVPQRMSQVVSVDGNRLGPSKPCQHERERAQRIEMGQRIQRDPSLPSRRWIATSLGNERVRQLVNRHGHEERGDLQDKTLEEAERIAEEIGHPPPCEPSSSPGPSTEISGAAIRYRASSHPPRSMSRHESEQKGRCGLPCQAISLAQRGQCECLVTVG